MIVPEAFWRGGIVVGSDHQLGRVIKVSLGVALTVVFLMISVAAFSEKRAAAMPLGLIFLGLSAYSAKHAVNRWRERA